MIPTHRVICKTWPLRLFHTKYIELTNSYSQDLEKPSYQLVDCDHAAPAFSMLPSGVPDSGVDWNLLEPEQPSSTTDRGKT